MRRKSAMSFILLLVILLIVTSAAPITAHAVSTNTYWIWPSGDLSGETDWSNIMAAFDNAVATGPGSTVQFAEGDFYVHRPIQVANFSGTVEGQGEELTCLHTAADRLFGLLEYPFLPYPSYMVLYLDDNWPVNQTANVTVSDLAFYIDGPSEPWAPYNTQINSMYVLEVLGIVSGYLEPDHANFELTHINANLQHLKAVADTGSKYMFGETSILESFNIHGEFVTLVDPGNGYWLYRWTKPVTGTYTFEDIEMYDSLFGLWVDSAKDSDIRIGGSENQEIVARGIQAATIELYDISNLVVEVSYLDFSEGEGGDVFLNQGEVAALGNDLGEKVPETLPERSSFFFHNNNIISESHGPWGAFELWNWGGWIDQPLGNVVITNNTINLVDIQPTSIFNGIFSYYVDNVEVTNNKFTGKGISSVMLGVYGEPATDWLIQGNNFENFNAEWAPIYLGKRTSNITVVGGNTKDNVIDLGTDNVLVGVNNQGGNSPGQDLSDALLQKKEIIKLLR